MSETSELDRRQLILTLSHEETAKAGIVAPLVTAASAFAVAATSATALAQTATGYADAKSANAAQIEAITAALPGLAEILRETGVDSLETHLVDLQTGQFSTDADPATYDQRTAADDPAQSIALASDIDIAGIGRRPMIAPVHLLRRGGEIALVVLPVHGRGYQSIIHAQLALQSDLKTVAALTILEQDETPGIGSRIEDPDWLELWRGRQITDESGAVRIAVVRRSGTPYEVDGISGATRTTSGVTSMLRFWLGEHGFGPFLSALRSGKLSP